MQECLNMIYLHFIFSSDDTHSIINCWNRVKLEMYVIHKSTIIILPSMYDSCVCVCGQKFFSFIIISCSLNKTSKHVIIGSSEMKVLLLPHRLHCGKYHINTHALQYNVHFTCVAYTYWSTVLIRFNVWILFMRLITIERIEQMQQSQCQRIKSFMYSSLPTKSTMVFISLHEPLIGICGAEWLGGRTLNIKICFYVCLWYSEYRFRHLNTIVFYTAIEIYVLRIFIIQFSAYWGAK